MPFTNKKITLPLFFPSFSFFFIWFLTDSFFISFPGTISPPPSSHSILQNIYPWVGLYFPQVRKNVCPNLWPQMFYDNCSLLSRTKISISGRAVLISGRGVLISGRAVPISDRSENKKKMVVKPIAAQDLQPRSKTTLSIVSHRHTFACLLIGNSSKSTYCMFWQGCSFSSYL